MIWGRTPVIEHHYNPLTFKPESRHSRMPLQALLPTREYGIERVFRDARAVTIGGGATEAMKAVAGRMMGF